MCVSPCVGLVCVGLCYCDNKPPALKSQTDWMGAAERRGWRVTNSLQTGSRSGHRSLLMTDFQPHRPTGTEADISCRFFSTSSISGFSNLLTLVYLLLLHHGHKHIPIVTLLQLLSHLPASSSALLWWYCSDTGSFTSRHLTLSLCTHTQIITGIPPFIAPSVTWFLYTFSLNFLPFLPSFSLVELSLLLSYAVSLLLSFYFHCNPLCPSWYSHCLLSFPSSVPSNSCHPSLPPIPVGFSFLSPFFTLQVSLSVSFLISWLLLEFMFL